LAVARELDGVQADCLGSGAESAWSSIMTASCGGIPSALSAWE
jgi:hypothetical protein